MGLSVSKALLRASVSGDVAIVHKLLEQRGYLHVDVTNSEGSTSLIMASCGGHSEIVTLLLKRHAYVNGANNKGFTAVMCASYHGYVGIVNLLIDAGADLDLANKDESTPLMFACFQGHFDVSSYAFINMCDVDTNRIELPLSLIFLIPGG